MSMGNNSEPKQPELKLDEQPVKEEIKTEVPVENTIESESKSETDSTFN